MNASTCHPGLPGAVEPLWASNVTGGDTGVESSLGKGAWGG